MPRTSTTRRSATSEEPSPQTRYRMQRQRRRDTLPEVALRRALHSRGWRYRVDLAVIPGMRRRADIVFLRQKVAVFVDGCFWHQCPVHATRPKNNAAWWQGKLATNVARDRETDRVLTEAGWRVVRVWEHEGVIDAIERVERVLTSPT